MKTAGEILNASTRQRQYADKLNSDSWKSFAASTKDAQGRFCQIYRRADVGLRIHHWFYDQNREPWEYSQGEVAVLCDGCHKGMHAALNDFRKRVFPHLTPETMLVLNSALEIGLKEKGAMKVAYAVKSLMESPRSIERFFEDALNPPTPVQEVIEKLAQDLRKAAE